MITLQEEHPLLVLRQEGETTHLDVRPYLEAGGIPYTILMDCLRQMIPGERLVVHLPYRGGFLADQARRLGFEVECRHMGPDHWQHRFRLGE